MPTTSVGQSSKYSRMTTPNMDEIPPAYSESSETQSMPTALQNFQENNFNQGQSLNASQGYNPGQLPFYASPGCTPIFYSCQSAPTDYSKYRGRQSVRLGIAKIIIGILCIAFHVTLISLSGIKTLGFVGHGIWGGVLFIIAGSLGIAGGKKKSRCLIIFYMIMCIVAAMAAAVILITGIIELTIDSCYYRYLYDSNYRYYMNDNSRNRYVRVCPEHIGAAKAMNILLVCLSAVAGALCIWGSILCCGAACCRGPQLSYLTPAVPVQFVQWNGNQQVLLVAQPNSNSIPQCIPYPGYPMQPTTTAPPYQPLQDFSVNQNPEGILCQATEKRALDDQLTPGSV